MADELVLAAGALLWRTGEVGIELAVVHRPRYDDWSLPKGKPEAGEHLTTCAVREVAEETGLDVRLGCPLGTVTYDTVLGPKVVHYWSAKVLGGKGFKANAEVDALRWLTPDDASAQLTYAHDTDVVDRALTRPVETTQVLLVRHAHAGERERWRGHDSQRPLDATGRRQALALAPVLGSFGPTVLRSADRVRCVQTLEPLAEELEIAIAVDGHLDDESVLEATDSAVAALRRWSTEATTVVCSQGDAIPAVVEALCSADGVAPARPRFPARKGSVWVLSFAEGRLVCTDYMPDAGASATW